MEIIYGSLHVLKRDKLFMIFFQLLFTFKKRKTKKDPIFLTNNIFFNRSFIGLLIAELVVWLILRCGKPFSHSFPKRRPSFIFVSILCVYSGAKNRRDTGLISIKHANSTETPFFFPQPPRHVANACIQCAERSLLAAMSAQKFYPAYFARWRKHRTPVSDNEMMKHNWKHSPSHSPSRDQQKEF